MTWAGAIAALKANCTTAGADVAPAITNIRIGEPDNLTQDTIALVPIGTRTSKTGGNTLTKVNIERGVEVKVYLRGAIRAGAIDETLEQRLVDVEAACFTRLWADSDCDGHAIGLAIESSDYGWDNVGDQLARTAAFIVWVDLAEVATISL